MKRFNINCDNKSEGLTYSQFIEDTKIKINLIFKTLKSLLNIEYLSVSVSKTVFIDVLLKFYELDSFMSKKDILDFLLFKEIEKTFDIGNIIINEDKIKLLIQDDDYYLKEVLNILYENKLIYQIAFYNLNFFGSFDILNSIKKSVEESI